MVNYLNSLCIFLVENVCLVLKDVLLQTSLEFPRLVLAVGRVAKPLPLFSFVGPDYPANSMLFVFRSKRDRCLSIELHVAVLVELERTRPAWL